MVDTSLFRNKAPKVMGELMKDFDLTDIQVAGILGNIGEECTGFHVLHEIGQPDGKGGYGWCQWTAGRRTAFLGWCKSNGLDWHSDQANYGYLRLELSGPFNTAVGAVERTSTTDEAVRAFERRFEMAKAGEEHFDSRNAYAEMALAAYRKPAPMAFEAGARRSGCSHCGSAGSCRG